MTPSGGHLGEVLALRETASSPTQVLSVGTDGAVVAWDLSSGAGHVVRSLGQVVENATFGDSRALVAWTSGQKVSIACATGCAKEWQLSKLKTRVTSIAFHENDSALIIGGADGRVYRWRFAADEEGLSTREQEKLLERYIAHQTVVSRVAALRAGRAFFSADWDGILYAWLAYTADDQQGSFDKNLFGGRFFGTVGTFMAAQRTPDRGITSMAVADDGLRLAIGTEDGFIEIWAVRGFQMIARTSAHNGRVTGVALSSNGDTIASVGRDGRIFIAHTIQNPLFRIKPGALAYEFQTSVSEEMKSSKDIFFTTAGNAIVTTTDGRLGEIKVAAPLPTATPQVLRPIEQPVDSDY